MVRWEQTLPVTDADAAVPTAAAPKPPAPKPQAHSHPQLLRLRGPATPAPAADAYAGEDAAAAAAAAKAAAAAARFVLLPRRNPALVSGAWLAEVRWGDDAAPPARPVPLLLDLTDASMTFALRPVPGEATARAAARVAAVVFGTVQMPPDGKAIILGADRQTTGGYPVVGVVASVDHARIAQIRPGERLRFQVMDVIEARAALLSRERQFAQLRIAAAAWWREE